jgi:4-hydroxy-tetrahydrodipicolinate synthase
MQPLNLDRLAGVFAAVLTPFDEAGEPDPGLLALHCRWLLAHGCDGLSINGTTGEANSLSVDERIALLERLASDGIPAQVLLPGTGCCAIPDTVRLTERAVQLGAAGVLMLPPFYYKNVTEEGLFAAYADVIERVGDGRLRVYLYHFPQMTGVPITADLVERLRRRYPETIAGMKDSSGVLANMTEMAMRFPDLDVFSGSDELLLPLLRAGGAGSISGVANLAAPLCARVYAAWRQGDQVAADAAQERLTSVRKEFLPYPLSAALKAVLAVYTGQESWRCVRPPLSPLPTEPTEAIAAALDRLGFAPPSNP